MGQMKKERDKLEMKNTVRVRVRDSQSKGHECSCL